jgi:hypothetical protein
MVIAADPGLTPTVAEDPVLKPIGESLWVVWKARGAVLEFTRLSEHHDALSAEVTVSNANGTELHWARVNLASTQARGALVKAVEEAEPTGDWRPIIERSCRLVAKHLRTGDPAVDLVPELPERVQRWSVEGWIPQGQITVLCGDGGTGKSYLALALVVSGLLDRAITPRWHVRPIRRALYLDWESDRSEQAARLWGLGEALHSQPAAGRLLHRTMRRPLRDEIVAVRAEVARQEVDFVVADSLGPACGPEPESADAAVTTLLALRSLAVTVLCIAHVSKQSAGTKAPARPFGSVYVQNLARSVIEARRSEAEGQDETDYTVSLYHRKSNHGRLCPLSAFRFSFEPGGAVLVTSGEPDTGGASLPFQVIEALKAGPKKPGQLAEELDAVPATVKKALQRLENRDMVVRVGGDAGGKSKEQLWGLAVRNRDTNRDGDPFGVPVREPGDESSPF